jgi:hypothetical protein
MNADKIFDCTFDANKTCTVCRRATNDVRVRRNCHGYGLGDFLSDVLKRIGITPRRVEAVLGKPCGCNRRKAAMNAAVMLRSARREEERVKGTA